MKKPIPIKGILKYLFLAAMLSLTLSSKGQQVAELSLEKNQVISFITSKQLPGTDQLKNEYFQSVFPPAQANGFTPIGMLRIKSVKLHGATAESHVGEGDLMSIYSWPNQSAIEDFNTTTPEWPELKAKRKEIWEELRVIRMTMKESSQLIFSSDKTYRLVFIWLDQDNPQNLGKYQKAMKKTREKLGAKYIAQWEKVDYYHSFIEPSEVPDLAWIIEWPSSQAHLDYLASEEFSQNVQLFMSGTSKFEAYETAFFFGN